MDRVKREITIEDYKKGVENGAGSLIPDYIHMGYGVYGATVYEHEGKYYLTYECGSSCD